MQNNRKIKNALISVFHKDGLAPIVKKLNELNINIYSTGGTEEYIKKQNIDVNRVEDLTSYPSILAGRVKTLHPNVFGGILSRRDEKSDKEQLDEYQIPEFDLVIVDLYPFEKTIKSNASEQEIIEKIDIGGISLIRAAAKNYKDVLVVSELSQYKETLDILNTNQGNTNLEHRKRFAINAFNVTSHYDCAIFNYFNKGEEKVFKHSILEQKTLRYGENPHQQGSFFGNLDNMFTKLNGKELSYNNILDIDAAVNLISEFNETTFAVLKHNNACGVASRVKLVDAWKDALAGDPTSAFGGVLVTNKEIDFETASEINKLFYEVLIAPSFSNEALNLLSKKKKRVLLKQKNISLPKVQFRTVLDGILFQEKDLKTDLKSDMRTVTQTKPDNNQLTDLVFASKICKHTKSNTIVFVKNKQLLASGVGQTSRVDALKQAVVKAKSFGLNLENSVMASDAFFPFPDCVELAKDAGTKAVIQPGGSINDQLSVDFCDKNRVAMVLTGTRHFKH
ncbi:MAG: bifunctional phosphoribosylaminoimidazolecarboxamide formyltransferase/IMP cyclohydrolase PurH [Flavobacteriales bacterium]|nr:bifunctional phosphoribosylaminoimidazolecarboxamide formyltransferase/IMP cyclohydrolase PurH [Flavobacteriales bacterium]|tara:strand:+ start:138 stop:1661 length:1524 start_codon:yes stop_codon:yes gene_type:complete